jgi:hypothetical protein
VRRQQSFIFRTSVRFIALIALVWVIGSLLWGQTDASLDKGGTVFNVKAYGATGEGSTDDTASIQHAIDAALSAGGGIVYFPVGRYLLKGTLTNSRVDLISLVGSGMGTNVLVNANVGISLGSTAGLVAGYHNGRIQGMHISCSNQSKSTAVQMTDMVSGPQLIDLTVSKCDQAFDVINRTRWTERLFATNVTDDLNNHLFHLDGIPSNPTNSYGYGLYDGIYVNKVAGQDVFYLTGGGYLYNSKFVIKGNFDPNANGASIFNVQGKSGEPCPGAAYNTVDIAVEGGSYSVVRANNNGCKGGAAGNALFGGIGPIRAPGSLAGSNGSISDSSTVAFLSATFTAGSSTSDSVSVRTAGPGSQCYVEPTNAIAAAAINGTYVSSANWSTVNVAHPSKAAGGTFQIWCTAQ